MLHGAELLVIVALEYAVLNFAGVLVVHVEVPSVVTKRIFVIRETVRRRVNVTELVDISIDVEEPRRGGCPVSC